MQSPSPSPVPPCTIAVPTTRPSLHGHRPHLLSIPTPISSASTSSRAPIFCSSTSEAPPRPRWLDQSAASAGGGRVTSIRVPYRDMNLETLQTMFAGPYLTKEARKIIDRDYNLFNVGLMDMPVDLPGLAFQRARLAVARLVHTLGECARKSKACMCSGGKLVCLIDYWMQDTVREIDKAVDAGRQGFSSFDIKNDELRDATLLVFANKQNLSNAMNVAEITDKLGLHSLRQ